MRRSNVGTAVLGMLVSLSPASAAAQGITDPNASLPPAAIPEQPVGAPFQDPIFGTTLTRVTGASLSGGYGTHIYSQLQTFSVDNFYVLLIESDGYVVRRMAGFTPVAGLDTSGWNAPRWQPALPHTIVHYDTNADDDVTVQYTNVDTLVTTDVFTFPAQYERILGNQSFDELSRDGRWMAGMVVRGDGAGTVFALDLLTMSLGAELAVPDLYAGPCQPDPSWGEVEPDWIAVSPLGNYLVIQWARDGTTRCSGLETFHLQTGAFVGRVYDGHQHGDLGVMPDGTTEFFMTTELSSPMDNNRPATAYRRLPGTSTVSQPVYLRVVDWSDSDHISCQGPRGVCLISWGSWPGDGWTPFEDELFLQYTDGSVLRLTHHRSSKCGYWVQPRASLSLDGSLAIFASDWGSARCGGGSLGRGEAYVVELSINYCGDGEVDEGEACDDGNEIDGDGCDTNCTWTACGNGIVTAAEECDDGNTDANDCCSNTCQAQPLGQLCSDANVCNGLETCDGAGHCAAGTPLDCADGDLCTQDACDPLGGCQSNAPAPLCRSAGRAQLLLRDRADNAKDKLVWAWRKGEETALADFYNPLAATTYGLCIYDSSAGTPLRVAQLLVPPGGAWRASGAKGRRYRDPSGASDGVITLTLRAGLAGRPQMKLKAQGVNLPVPTPFSSNRFFQQDPSVLVQLVNSEGQCWGTEFTTARKNTIDQFKATSP